MRRLLAIAALLAPATAFAQASPSAFTSGTRYDAAGRVTGTISADPDGAGSLPFLAVRTSYDPAGRPLRVETGTLAAWQSEAVAPAAWSGFSVLRTLETAYDAAGHKARESVRVGAAGPVVTLTQYSYDALGRLDCTAQRLNPAVYASLPASACTLGTQGGDGPDRISRNVYDAAGQRLQLRVAVGTADEGATATWSYNLNGQVTTLVDGNGNRAELRYDGFGRQDRWTFPSPTRPAAFNDSTPASAMASAGSVNASDYEGYTTDPAGQRTSLRKRDGSTLTYSFDALGRMTLKSIATQRTDLTAQQVRPVYYGYDLRGLQLYARFDSASGEGVTNAFNGFGQLASTTSNMGGTSRTLAYQYDRDGNRITVTHPDGTSFTYAYDGLDRPYLMAAPGLTLAYTSYAPAGLPDGSSRGNGELSIYAYDGVQRLSTLTHIFPVAPAAANVQWQLARNPAGQIAATTRINDNYAWGGAYPVTRQYGANGLNQYDSINTVGGATLTLAYDANGNLIGDGSNTYVYDVENRLVRTSGGHDAGLAYDPLGRLWQVTSPTGAGAVTTTFLYDGDALVADYNGAAMLHRYAHWVGADVPVVAYAGASLAAPSYLHADQQGSIVALSNASGSVTAIDSYDEYGIPAPTNAGRFQYTGQIWLGEIGLYSYKSRLYSPTLGRFMQIDPIGYADQFNLYEYVGSDPVNRTDPSGRQSCPKDAGPDGCPDIPFPTRSTSEGLEGAVRASPSDGESGGQALRNNETGQIRYRTGSEAGSGDTEEFRHRPAPAGETTILRGHTHRWNNSERGLAGQARRRGQNAPSREDQTAMHGSRPGQGRPVQTIGPDVTTTMARYNRQDYLRVDSGNRAMIPDLSAQHIIVCETDSCPP